MYASISLYYRSKNYLVSVSNYIELSCDISYSITTSLGNAFNIFSIFNCNELVDVSELIFNRFLRLGI